MKLQTTKENTTASKNVPLDPYSTSLNRKAPPGDTIMCDIYFFHDL